MVLNSHIFPKKNLIYLWTNRKKAYIIISDLTETPSLLISNSGRIPLLHKRNHQKVTSGDFVLPKISIKHSADSFSLPCTHIFPFLPLLLSLCSIIDIYVIPDSANSHQRVWINGCSFPLPLPFPHFPQKPPPSMQ